MFKKMFVVVCMGVVVLAVAGLSSAALIAYEGFDYPMGDLGGKGSAGNGWTGSWNGGGNYKVIANSLDMPNLPFTPTGGAAQGHSTANRNFDAIDFGTDGVYYISFLVKRTGWEANDGSGEWFDVHMRTSSYGRIAAWGISSDEKFETTELGATNKVAGANTTDVYFLVGKVVIYASQPDEIYLKAYTKNDTIDLSETSNWTVSGSSEDSSDIASKLTLWAGTDGDDGNGEYQATVDEIRIGTTWSDVVPVPEPATIMLISMGLLAIKKH